VAWYGEQFIFGFNKEQYMEEDHREVTNKTLQYILQSLDVMIKNETVLLDRIRKLEKNFDELGQGLEILAGERLEELGLKDKDEDDDRIIN
jgi:hypothetical protein